VRVDAVASVINIGFLVTSVINVGFPKETVERALKIRLLIADDELFSLPCLFFIATRYYNTS